MSIKRNHIHGLQPNPTKGRLIPTSDNWHPNYPNDTVRGRIITDMSDDSLRICFWGADDFGMELDIPPDEWDAETVKKWERWMNTLSLVTVDMLKEMGFKNA